MKTEMKELLRGRFYPDADLVKQYIMAGHATMTLVSKKTDERFTFKFDTCPGKEKELVFVKVLTGSDNTADYQYAGAVWVNSPEKYRHGHSKSRIGYDAPSIKALRWFIAHLYSDNKKDVAKMFQQLEVWHEGTCGRCGRKLTVPESIASGFGPECAAKRGAA